MTAPLAHDRALFDDPAMRDFETPGEPAKGAVAPRLIVVLRNVAIGIGLTGVLAAAGQLAGAA